MRAAYARNGSKWIRRKRLAIYARDDWRCVWCTCAVYAPGKSPHGPQFSPARTTEARPLHVASLDHVRPRESGGSNKTENLITGCVDCNRLRGTKPASVFAAEVARRLWAADCGARDVGDGNFLVPAGATVREPSAFVLDVFARVLNAITRPL